MAKSSAKIAFTYLHNEDNVTSFKRSHAYTATLSSPNPAAGHYQLTPPLETSGPSYTYIYI